MPDLPREVERIIGLCLRKDAERRFQHMEDLKVALDSLKDESDSGMLATPVPAYVWNVDLSLPKNTSFTEKDAAPVSSGVF